MAAEATTGQAATPAELTSDVLRAYGATPEPRLREILQSLIRHLHAFATEVSLTHGEWLSPGSTS
jgi:hydroxyquinol 1,2-dioxygenase